MTCSIILDSLVEQYQKAIQLKADGIIDSPIFENFIDILYYFKDNNIDIVILTKRKKIEKLISLYVVMNSRTIPYYSYSQIAHDMTEQYLKFRSVILQLPIEFDI